jgi:hypothetical protein
MNAHSDVIEELDRVWCDAHSRVRVALRLGCTEPQFATSTQLDAIKNSCTMHAVTYQWRSLIYDQDFFRWHETPWLKKVLSKESEGGMLERVKLFGRAGRSRPLGVPRRFQVSGRNISYIRFQRRSGYVYVVLRVKFLPRMFCARLNRVEFDYCEFGNIYGVQFLMSTLPRLSKELIIIVNEYLHLAQSGRHILASSCWPYQRSVLSTQSPSHVAQLKEAR